MNTDYNTIQLHSIVLHSSTTPCLQTIRLPAALVPSDVTILPAPPHLMVIFSQILSKRLLTF